MATLVHTKCNECLDHFRALNVNVTMQIPYEYLVKNLASNFLHCSLKISNALDDILKFKGFLYSNRWHLIL